MTEGAAEGLRLLVRPPHPALRPWLRGLWAYVEVRPGALRRLEMPGPDAVLLFNLGPPLGVAWPDPAAETRFAEASGFLATPHPAPAVTRMAGYQAGVQAMLTPLGAERLLRAPLGGAGGLLLPLDAALPGGAAFAARLAETPEAGRRLDLVEALLLHRLAAAPPPRATAPDRVAEAWDRLAASAGRVSIGGLARDLGWSRQTLVSRFHARTGLTPKLAARLMRFGRVAQGLEAVGEAGWAALAAEAGYADQSHLIREVRALTGMTPGEMRRRRLPGGGGIALDAATFVQSPAGIDA